MDDFISTDNKPMRKILINQNKENDKVINSINGKRQGMRDMLIGDASITNQNKENDNMGMIERDKSNRKNLKEGTILKNVKNVNIRHLSTP